jgi:hypothetical protein
MLEIEQSVQCCAGPTSQTAEILGISSANRSYPETAFLDLIEANRRSTWTINAVIGKVGSSRSESLKASFANQLEPLIDLALIHRH